MLNFNYILNKYWIFIFFVMGDDEISIFMDFIYQIWFFKRRVVAFY